MMYVLGMVYVPPKYPGQIPTLEDLPNRQDDVDWLVAARYNELKKELRAALTELGVLPKGEFADVAARLAAGGVADKIIEGDTSVECIDLGTGEIEVKVDGVLVGKFNAQGLLSPTRPCFQITKTAIQSNIAVNTSVTIVFDSVRFDVGNNFAGNVFTAPVSGKYILTGNFRILNLDSAADYFYIRLITSNKGYDCNIFDPGVLAGDPAYWDIPFSFIADMDANDTAYVIAYQRAGAQQTDIDKYAIFSGGLFA